VPTSPQSWKGRYVIRIRLKDWPEFVDESELVVVLYLTARLGLLGRYRDFACPLASATTLTRLIEVNRVQELSMIGAIVSAVGLRELRR